MDFQTAFGIQHAAFRYAGQDFGCRHTVFFRPTVLLCQTIYYFFGVVFFRCPLPVPFRFNLLLKAQHKTFNPARVLCGFQDFHRLFAQHLDPRADIVGVAVGIVRQAQFTSKHQ